MSAGLLAAALTKRPVRGERGPVPVTVRREPWLAVVGRLVAYGVTGAVFAWPLAVPEPVAATAVLAVVGAALGALLARTRVTFGASLLVAAVLSAVVVVLRGWVLEGAMASWLGPARALALGQAVTLAGGALVVSATLRFLSARRRTFAVAEVAAVGLAFGQLVAAHRHGAINRPFDIADPMIAAGDDPTLAFLIIGGAGAATTVLLLLSERRVWRAALAVTILFGVLALVVQLTGRAGLPAAVAGGDGLGLRGDPADEERQRERNQGGSGRRDNDELEFRDNYDNPQNRVPVGVVLLHEDYSPPSGVYYFRQGAFSQYNGRRLVTTTRPDADQDLAPGFPAAAEPVRGQPPATAPRAEVATTVALLTDHTRPFGLEAPIRFQPGPNPDPSRFRRVYRVDTRAMALEPLVLLGTPAFSPEWAPGLRAHYLKAPADPRYAELGDEILNTTLPAELRDDPTARALAVTGWLGERGTYSLRSRHADSNDPTASFLFGDKTGYCVHFAHAATYLLRTLGVPSRVATGYAIDESARQGGSAILLSGQDSHAWPEIYLEGVGWVVMDVAPQTVLDPPGPPPDPDLQRLLGELARGLKPLAADGQTARPLARRAQDLLGSVVATVVALLALTLVLAFLGKLWRRLCPYLHRGARREQLLYRAELDRLSDLALRRQYGETREAFARRLRAALPAVDDLTSQHMRSRYGPASATAAGHVTAAQRATRRQLQGELRRNYPAWRRALGMLHPFAWLKTR